MALTRGGNRQGLLSTGLDGAWKGGGRLKGGLSGGGQGEREEKCQTAVMLLLRPIRSPHLGWAGL